MCRAHFVCHMAVYMAPEYLKKGHISDKVDAYAVGVVLLELLTGLNPGQVCV